MSNLIGPTHHLFYGVLHRRRIWFTHLAEAFDIHAKHTWRDEKKSLENKYRGVMSNLSGAEHLGLQRPLNLASLIDDTPVGSFLVQNCNQLDSFELELFGIFEREARDEHWVTTLGKVSSLWGRELAQECVLNPMMPTLTNTKNSLRGIFELFQLVLQGGAFASRPMLLRRYTDTQLHYELRFCAHRREHLLKTELHCANHACKLESFIYQGFAQALIPQIHFERHTRTAYCLDELSFQ